MLSASLLFSVFSGALPASAAGSTGNSTYTSNQGKLQSEAFMRLPLGAVQPAGWLLDQLELQKNGITGAMEEYGNYGANSGWLGGTGESWEKGSYYVRGLVALAYTLHDDALIEKAQKWIDWSLNSQTSSGFFGPSNNDDWWARMPMLVAIRDYYEATEYLGTPDERVMPFFEKYFRYQLKTLPSRPLTSWAQARGGDNLEVVYWLYNRLYDESDPSASDWLLDLAKLIESQTTDWTNSFTNTTVREHVVNTSQALKTPVLYYQQSGSAADRDALKNALLNISIDHGRIDTLPNADESPQDNKPTRGTELCGIVESMLSTELAIGVLGDVDLADRLELIAYNSLPAAYAPDYKGASYFISQNQVLATAGNHEFSTDHGDDLTFGAPCGYECCFPNNHMGWPKYVQSMWMATENDGLAVIAYGPNKVTATVAGGKTAVFNQETDYPFDEAIRLDYAGETAGFELKLRIPTWCESPVVTVNGRPVDGLRAGEFVTVDRNWREGDTVEIQFPMEIETSSWYNNAVAVQRGPLIYSLKIGQEWVENTDPELRQMHEQTHGGLLAREVYPTSRWNYGLVLNEDDPASSFEVVKREMTEQPYDTDTAPVVLKAKGQILPQWTLDGNLVGDVPAGATPYDETMVEDIELIPFGAAKLRITQFPRIGTYSDTVELDAEDMALSDGSSGTVREFKNVIVPKANDYTMEVSYKGEGRLTLMLNNKNVGSKAFAKDGGTLTVSGLKSAVSDESFKFSDAHINNIRFVGDAGVEITGIKITPAERTQLTVHSVTGGNGCITVETNLSRELSQYTVHYGTASGEYDRTASGFRGGKAVLTGLDAGTYYLRVEAQLYGETVTSGEYTAVVTGEKTDDPGRAVIAPEAPITDNFEDSAYSDTIWTKIGATSKINVTGGKLTFGDDGNVKAMVNGGDAWNDYAVEAKIKLIDVKEYNNAGIMFRTTGAGSGPDAFNGYYFGIKKGQVMLGYGNGGWNLIKDVPCAKIAHGQEYALKILLSGNKMAFYVDGELVYTYTDDRYKNGTVGVRSYEESFTVDDFEVRALTAEDQAAIDAAFSPAPMDVTAARYSGLVQLRYPYLASAEQYVVMYGTEPGVYTNEVYGHYYNSFTGGAAGATAVTLPDDGKTYYVRVAAVNGGVQVGLSDEIEVELYREPDDPVDPVLKGDLDGNDVVNVADIIMLKSLIMNGVWSERDLAAGDIDDNKTLNVSDMLAVKNIIMMG